jgi:hypothetical protein
MLQTREIAPRPISRIYLLASVPWPCAPRQACQLLEASSAVLRSKIWNASCNNRFMPYLRYTALHCTARYMHVIVVLC